MRSNEDDWGPWQAHVADGGTYDPDYGIPRQLGMVTASAPPIVVNGVVVARSGQLASVVCRRAASLDGCRI